MVKNVALFSSAREMALGLGLISVLYFLLSDFASAAFQISVFLIRVSSLRLLRLLAAIVPENANR